jgi:hypothetical protein
MAVEFALEQLERRVFLSVSSISPAGVITAIGTDGNDTITVGLAEGNASTLTVTVNGSTDSYTLSQVTEIDVYGLGGNDNISVNQVAGPLHVPVMFSGGAGCDTLTGGAGPATLLGGLGADRLVGVSSSDYLSAGHGADGVVDQDGTNCTLLGGLGANTVSGSGASDHIVQGPNPISSRPGGVQQFQPDYVANSGVNSNIFLGTASGYSPAQIRQAYGLGSPTQPIDNDFGQGQTIAIVDAFSNPTVFSDLTTFSQQFGLPAPTASNFQIVTPSGSPASNTDWGTEIDLDVEWAHAIAPQAKIILVESSTNYGFDLFKAVQTAASMVNQAGGGVVSMSFGSAEDTTNDPTYDAMFQSFPTVSFLASSGDVGAVVSYPASSQLVTAVGGTTLPLDIDGNRIGDETGWADSGGGLSTLYTLPPSYQANLTYPVAGVATTITTRAAPDVAWVADPNTGAAVFDASGDGTNAGWLPGGVGGTSLSSPSFAGFVAMANELRHALGESVLGARLTQQLYSASAADTSGNGGANLNFNDILSGNATDAATGAINYAGPGYDLVTGLGSPNCPTLLTTLASSNVPFVSNTFTYSAEYFVANSTAGSTTVITAPEIPSDLVGTGTVEGGNQINLLFTESTASLFQPTGTYAAPPTIAITGGDAGTGGAAINNVVLYVAPDGSISGFGLFVASGVTGEVEGTPTTSGAFNLQFSGRETVDSSGVAHIDVSFWTIDTNGVRLTTSPFGARAQDVLVGQLGD